MSQYEVTFSSQSPNVGKVSTNSSRKIPIFLETLHVNDIEVIKIHTNNKAVVYVLPRPVRLSETLVGAILSDA